MFRLTRGRATASSWAAGLPIVLLSTTGAKTGKVRTLPVLGLFDGKRFVVIASNYGQPHHPAWYHNLRAHPRAWVAAGGVTHEVEARELTGEERDRCFDWGVRTYAGFARYQRWAAGRRIPVFRLDPIPTAPLRSPGDLPAPAPPHAGSSP